MYLLDTATHSITLITTTYAILTLLEVVFAPNSQLMVVSWENYETSGFDFDVHDRSGQRIAHFEDAGLVWVSDYSRPGSLACAMGDRVATAHQNDFAVWDMRSGGQLGTRGPGAGDESHKAGMSAAQVVANSTGSRFAFCGEDSLDVHLYDAVSLEALGKFRLADEDMVFDMLGYGHQLESMQWEGGGFLLLSRPFDQGAEQSEQYVGVYFCRSQLGSSSLTGKLRGGPAPGLKTALSPGGAFVFEFQPVPARVAVYDTRSGQRVLLQDVDVPRQDKKKAFASADLRWCDSGHRLLVTLGDSEGVEPQSLVLQF